MRKPKYTVFFEALLCRTTESAPGTVEEYIREAEAFRKGRIKLPASLLFYLLSKDRSKEELITYLENRIELASTEMEARCIYHLTNSAALLRHDFRNGNEPHDQKTHAYLQSQAIKKLYESLELNFAQAMTPGVVEKATAEELLYTKNSVSWKIAESPNPFESQLIKESVKEYPDDLLRSEQSPVSSALLFRVFRFDPLRLAPSDRRASISSSPCYGSPGIPSARCDIVAQTVILQLRCSLVR